MFDLFHCFCRFPWMSTGNVRKTEFDITVKAAVMVALMARPITLCRVVQCPYPLTTSPLWIHYQCLSPWFLQKTDINSKVNTMNFFLNTYNYKTDIWQFSSTQWIAALGHLVTFLVIPTFIQLALSHHYWMCYIYNRAVRFEKCMSYKLLHNFGSFRS